MDALINTGDVDPASLNVGPSVMTESIDSGVVGGLTFSITSSTALTVGSVGQLQPTAPASSQTESLEDCHAALGTCLRRPKSSLHNYVANSSVTAPNVPQGVILAAPIVRTTRTLAACPVRWTTPFPSLRQLLASVRQCAAPRLTAPAVNSSL